MRIRTVLNILLGAVVGAAIGGVIGYFGQCIGGG